jgi:TrkA domain protein
VTEIREVKLPGVGVRYEFTTEEGKYVGVVSHRSGRKELYVAHPKDPDAFKRILGFSERDARALAEMLGWARVAEELTELQQRVEGLAIDWLPVRDNSHFRRRAAERRARARLERPAPEMERDEMAVMEIRELVATLPPASEPR